MINLNKVQFTGRVGSVKVQQFQSEQIVNIRLAVSERYTKRDGTAVDETLWLTAVVAGRSSDFAAKYIATGDLIYIEGRLKERTYTTKDGTEKTELEVRCTDVQIVTKKGDNEQAAPAAQRTAPDPVAPRQGTIPMPDTEEEDLPF